MSTNDYHHGYQQRRPKKRPLPPEWIAFRQELDRLIKQKPPKPTKTNER